MITKEKLNALKAEYEAVLRKLAELTEDELAQVTGGKNSFLDTFSDEFDFNDLNVDGNSPSSSKRA